MLKRVQLYNWRNLKNSVIDTNYKSIYLVGANAQGKTNFIDALYYLSFSSSFLKVGESELLKRGESSFYLKGLYEREGESLELLTKFENKKKEIFLNKSLIGDRRELIFTLATVVFSSTDINFVLGSPQEKRWFFDQAISLISSSYLTNLRKYKKILKQRNKALKMGDIPLIRAYNEIFAESAIEITLLRQSFIKNFNSIFHFYLKELLNLSEELVLEYIPSLKTLKREEVLQLLRKAEERELREKITLTGPHKDNYEIMQDNFLFKEGSSNGQNRAVSLAYRLTQTALFYKRFKKNPLFLFDDVFLELESAKREKFLSLIPSNAQCFFTFLPDFKYKLRSGSYIVYNVVNGEMRG